MTDTLLPPGYESTAEALKVRILKLIPEHPEILTMSGPWALFNVRGFTCADLAPSLGQASWALGAAKRAYERGERA